MVGYGIVILWPCVVNRSLRVYRQLLERQRGKYWVRLLLRWKMKCNCCGNTAYRQAGFSSARISLLLQLFHFLCRTYCRSKATVFVVLSFLDSCPKVFWRSQYFRIDWPLRSHVVVMYNKYTRPRVFGQTLFVTDGWSSLSFLTFWRRNYFLILAHSVYKMWIIQEPNTLQFWNKLHFEE